jgi:membrane-associated phospholipid phosphatase
MKDMQFLKENKNLLFAVLMLPLIFLYLDDRIILWMKAIQEEKSSLYYFLAFIDPFMHVISDGTTLALIAGMLYVIGKFINIRLTEAGKYLCIGFLTTGITVQIVKHLCGRARPKFMDEVSFFIGPTLKGGYDSFPSGHATVVFCFAYILSRYFPRQRILFVLYAVIVSLYRIENCSHFPSDVVAGALVGIIVGKVLFRLLQAKQLPRHPKIIGQS